MKSSLIIIPYENEHGPRVKILSLRNYNWGAMHTLKDPSTSNLLEIPRVKICQKSISTSQKLKIWDEGYPKSLEDVYNSESHTKTKMAEISSSILKKIIHNKNEG